MIFSTILNPEIITSDNFDKYHSNFEHLRQRFKKNLIFIFDKDGILKNELKKKLNQLKNNKTSPEKLLFVNTFIDHIIKYNNKYFVSNSKFEKNYSSFANSIIKNEKYLNAILNNNVDENLNNEVENIFIENFTLSKLYKNLIRFDSGIPGYINELDFNEFDNILLSLLWNTDQINFYDEVFASSIVYNSKTKKNYWKYDEYKKSRYNSLNYIKKFLIIKKLQKKIFKINIYTSLPPKLHRFKEIYLNLLKECFPANENNVMFELCIKLRDTDKYITHKRFMEVKSSLLDIDYGFNFLDSDQNLEESEWKFSNSWSKIREFKDY